MPGFSLAWVRKRLRLLWSMGFGYGSGPENGLSAADFRWQFSFDQETHLPLEPLLKSGQKDYQSLFESVRRHVPRLYWLAVASVWRKGGIWQVAYSLREV